MATQSLPATLGNPAYPTSDGRPMAETDIHRQNMNDLIETLDIHFQDDPLVYVSGNLLMFYVRGNKRKHISPDVFVVKGIVKGQRLNYIIWEEGKAPRVVIELTSSSTRAVDTKKKFALYQDVLRVPEYFMFDPHGDYLDPPLQGYRLQKGLYVPIRPIHGRLPSKELGLHLEGDDDRLRLDDPATGERLATPREAWRQEALARQQAQAELARLRQELDRLRHDGRPNP